MRTLRVEGTGEVKAEPDEGWIDLAVETQAPDRALAAGANRVDGVRFALSKEDAVRAEALRQAVERARRTAEVLASSLGVRLGPVLDASTVAEVPSIYPARMALEAADKRGGPTTPILPEEQTITARVMIVFAIEGR